ncbi:MAG TPA: ribosome biogenesis factor YjgA [Luteimonas sp.]|nr:ribosome biogenesis factor YjgA [Luteimonas sp.]
MRGKDEDTGAFLAPSRSQQRREALDVLVLAQQLVSLDPGRLARLPIPEDVRGHIADSQRVTSHIARKRQVAFLAKQLRRESDDTLEAIRDGIDAGGASARQVTALLHRVEAWRARLLDEGDGALAEFLDACPGADRQQLRQLVRNALEERRRDKPPHNQRELFRTLRELLQASETMDHDGNADVDLDSDADADVEVDRDARDAAERVPGNRSATDG